MSCCTECKSEMTGHARLCPFLCAVTDKNLAHMLSACEYLLNEAFTLARIRLRSSTHENDGRPNSVKPNFICLLMYLFNVQEI